MNEDAEYSFQWNSPPAGGPVDYTSPREVRRFKTLAEYQRATGQDRNSRSVDYSVFVNAAPPDFTNPTKLVSPDDVDLRLRPRSRAVDGGTVLPGSPTGSPAGRRISVHTARNRAAALRAASGGAARAIDGALTRSYRVGEPSRRSTPARKAACNPATQGSR